jgi:hypothetical protein
MRLICTLLIGFLAASAAATASAGERTPQTFVKPGTSAKPGAQGLVPRSSGGSGLSVTVPLTVIPQIAPRSCAKGTTGKWPNCRAIARNCPGGTIGKWPDCRKPDLKRCPKGTAGTWPDCIDIATPRDRSCPEGQIRKGKKCVELTESGGAGTAKPRTPKAQNQKIIPPEIAALTADRPHRPREILTLVDAARASEIATRLQRQYNVTAEPRVSLPLLDGAIIRLRLKGDRSLDSLLEALSTDPGVQLAQPNYAYGVSEDPALDSQSIPQYAGEKIRLKEAHDLARGRGVMVAVIDTTIEVAHPELAGAVAGAFDALEGGASKAEAHGTEIAGILAARARLIGVAPEAKLLSVRAFKGGGAQPAQSTTLQLLRGIDWAFDAGAKVMNMSFAGPKDPLLERIIKAAADKGVIFVAAAGNNGPKAAPVYPAAYPEVIAVTATDEDDKLYGKANRGDYISIAAPGVDILAPAPKSRYELSSGTSMAAAHVSGVVALLLERDAKLGSDEVRAILSSTARKPDGSFDKDSIGSGIVDAASALGKEAKGEPSAEPTLGTARSGTE